MKEFYFLLILMVAFFFYFSLGKGGIETAGAAGIRVLLFFASYSILTIYRYYYDKIMKTSNNLSVSFKKLLVSAISIGLPILLVGSDAKDGQAISPVSVVLVFLLFIIALDFNNRLRVNIVNFFDERTKDGGDMFFTYPPRNVFDILLPIFFYLFIAFVLYLIL